MYNNPFYNQPRFQQPQYIDNISQFNKPIGLLGKVVDSLDVVKATDIPLDGSITYFPLIDGSAIVTKQLKMDGTSKTVIYKPIEEEKVENPQYVTIEEFNKAIKEIKDKFKKKEE